MAVNQEKFQIFVEKSVLSTMTEAQKRLGRALGQNLIHLAPIWVDKECAIVQTFVKARECRGVLHRIYIYDYHSKQIC